MLSGCRQEECTVAETGACLFNNDPTTCPFQASEVVDSNSTKSEVELVLPLEEPEKKPQFPISLSLTLTQAREIMHGRYFNLVGILGPPNAGKTASLVSLYLLISRGRLAGFSYADSRTLMAFHEISQGARQWSEGQLPEQLTTHTELVDDRTAGFLHLRLKPSDREEALDLLFSDLPGEWTTALTDNNRVDRLKFLKRADVVWLVVDGQQLSELATRQLTLHRTQLLLQRLADLLVPVPRVILVVTRKDMCEPDEKTLDILRADARSKKLCMEVVLIASFAERETVSPGDGIAELISLSTLKIQDTPAFWPDVEDSFASTRSIMQFRKLKEN